MKKLAIAFVASVFAIALAAPTASACPGMKKKDDSSKVVKKDKKPTKIAKKDAKKDEKKAPKKDAKKDAKN